MKKSIIAVVVLTVISFSVFAATPTLDDVNLRVGNVERRSDVIEEGLKSVKGEMTTLAGNVSANSTSVAKNGEKITVLESGFKAVERDANDAKTVASNANDTANKALDAVDNKVDQSVFDDTVIDLNGKIQNARDYADNVSDEKKYEAIDQSNAYSDEKFDEAKKHSDDNLNEAKGFAASEATKAKGEAITEANKHSDDNMNIANKHSDDNLNIANKHSDDNLGVAKKHSDDNLNTAKSFATSEAGRAIAESGAYTNLKVSQETTAREKAINAERAERIEGDRRTLQAANSYTDSRITQLNSRISEVRDEAKAGTASAFAQAAIPQVDANGRFLIGAGAGTYSGQSAVAVGLSARINNNTVTKFSVSTDTQHNFGASAGIGYSF